jgi:branched-chain amino acid transport system ATP-binding protein
LLEVTGLRAGYGTGPDVLQDAALDVGDGEMVALIGLNGAGKSTMVRTIAGLLPVRAGQLRFQDQDVSKLSTDARARLGILLVPEGRELCATMSVEENLALGTVPLSRSERRTEGKRNLDLVHELFPILHEKRKQSAGSLSGGQQQMVAIARALMGSPRLLILDEPSLGLAPLLVREIFESVKRLNEQGLSVLVVEQNAAIAIKYSDRAYHLELGEVSPTDASGEQRSLMTNVVESSGAPVITEALTLPAYRSLGRSRAGEPDPEAAADRTSR